MDKIFRLVVFLCVGFGCGSVQAGLMLAGNDAAHIALGNQGSNRSVGWVKADTVGVDRGGFNLIDDGWWGVTAKHVASDLATGSLYSNIRSGFGNSANNVTEMRGVAQVFLHPTQDLALFQFSSPFSTEAALQRFRGEFVIGSEAYTVGYGALRYVNEATSVFTGDRRAGFDVVEGRNLFNQDLLRTRFNNSNQINYRLLEMGLTPSDSGGGLISNSLLSGVNIGGSLEGMFGQSSFYLDLNRGGNAFIDATQLANPITAVPEPASLALLMFVGGPFGGVYAAIKCRKKKKLLAFSF